MYDDIKLYIMVYKSNQYYSVLYKVEVKAYTVSEYICIN